MAETPAAEPELEAGDDTNINDRAMSNELSPAPSSSEVSSVDPGLLGEIVVGSHMHGPRKASPGKAASDHDDDMNEDVDEADPIPAQYPKRKRSSVYMNLGEDKLEDSFGKDDEESATPSRVALPTSGTPRRHGSAAAKHVPIGYWRESQVPDPAGKHIVIGFMDVRDRLRTRVLSHTRSGGPVNPRLFPLPPGPGGSWVTFDRIVFDDHLIGCDHETIKEYVKIRAETLGAQDSAEEKQRLNMAAVEEAKRRTENREPDPTAAAQPILIAYGVDVPEGAHGTVRSTEAKRRRLGSASNLHAAYEAGPPQQPTPVRTPTTATDSKTMDIKEITRPTRILVGCWKKSEAVKDEDKLAVYGILGNNDMFRVKLVRETMDGRFSDQSFPAGAGALWVAYEDVLFLEHLRRLGRPEIKEYVRVRQSQLDAGEAPEDREANEIRAADEAQRRVTNNPNKTPISVVTHIAPRQTAAAPEAEDAVSQELRRPLPQEGTPARTVRRELATQNEARPIRHSMPTNYSTRHQNAAILDHAERQRAIVSRQMDRMEAAQARDDRYLMNRAPIAQPEMPKEPQAESFANIDRLQKVWESQEQNRMRGNDNAKLYMGVKYERKQGGPFKGKLVSQGQIISIDGEDYVEYRVLTKPSFF